MLKLPMLKHVTATNVQQDLRHLQAVAEVLIAAVVILRANITVQAARVSLVNVALRQAVAQCRVEQEAVLDVKVI